ncbi:XRE family transcriptional regulator [Streptomyces sp. t39]|uniref:XRE family transcriptional regulator n=1 Tax=Streptomyces sp. t39 TaxID=1828156 RepID=UPI0011CDB849|nr:XRE family transcriptional regulator [Streptomyces sp. t39]TXS35574.1 XRE family transcriptional regulator [Streptomyces sp. t39]
MAVERTTEENAALALGRALRELQQRSGCTLRSLESRVRISDSSLSRYFRGTTVPPWPTVRDLCRALGGDPAEFRVLWEAADRAACAPAGAAGRPGGTPSAPGGPISSATPPERAGARRRTLPRGRTAWAAAGVAVGAALGAALTALAWPAPTADGAGTMALGSPAGPPDGRIFVSRETGACLDSSLDKGLRAFDCNGLPYQRWTVREVPGDGVQLRNHATGRCLDHGAGLRAVACGSSATQRWTLTPRGDGAVEVQNAGTRHCLDAGATGLRGLPCTPTPRQMWA